MIEYSRNVLGWKNANSTEFDPDTSHPVIDYIPDQKNIVEKGGTMRLGAYECTLTPGTHIHKAYDKIDIKERHRHRFELNNTFREELIQSGMVMSGLNKKLDLVEAIELKDHPWFVAVQFHPEFKSGINKPHPLFVDLVAASLEYKRQENEY